MTILIPCGALTVTEKIEFIVVSMISRFVAIAYLKQNRLRYNPRFLNFGLLEVSMPIYEYLCNSCGAEKEHLQKISDAPIAACPVCGSNNYTKLISAAGFQLKGSGWYVTDFKNKTKPAETKPAAKESTESTPSAPPAAADAAAKKESSPATTATAVD
ncbi:putative regulatory protein, FmdB family [Nitrosomonas ureae]|uniref:Putative regulatory protein, FmdB family n=2 Tax=Nitrosomonas ureae TaxID=44577 RepID=A0A1H5UD71_9PROT|nr:putative regulatory protein, FmdB family [Nitrosomonas ureae]